MACYIQLIEIQYRGSLFDKPSQVRKDKHIMANVNRVLVLSQRNLCSKPWTLNFIIHFVSPSCFVDRTYLQDSLTWTYFWQSSHSFSLFCLESSSSDQEYSKLGANTFDTKWNFQSEITQKSPPTMEVENVVFGQRPATIIPLQLIYRHVGRKKSTLV